jgi:hypothetical protein
VTKPKPLNDLGDDDDDDFFEPKKAKVSVKMEGTKNVSMLGRDEEEDDDDEPFEEVTAKSKRVKVSSTTKKKKRVGDMSTDELLASFDYALPLGKDGKRLPSIRAFARPKCNCTHIFNEVFMEVKPSKLRQIIPVVTLDKTGKQVTRLTFGKALEKEKGGSLRSWKCPGWKVTYDGLKPIFGRKEGYSDGRTCRSIRIDEIKDYEIEANGKVVITKVGLTDAAIEFFKSPGARLSERGKEMGKVSFLV